MSDQTKKIIIICIPATIIAAAGITLYLYFSGFFLGSRSGVPPQAQAPADKFMTNREAYELAAARARQWQADAGLASINSLSGVTSGAGRSDDWSLLFVSQSKKGSGLRVEIADRLVSKTEEIPYFGEGGALPGELISSEEAIAKVRNISGYETEPIISVEMIYDGEASLWFWGVKTARGVISIKAEK